VTGPPPGRASWRPGPGVGALGRGRPELQLGVRRRCLVPARCGAGRHWAVSTMKGAWCARGNQCRPRDDAGGNDDGGPPRWGCRRRRRSV